MWSPCRNKYSISQELHDCPTLHSIFLVQTLTKDLVQIPALVMDWIMIRRIFLPLFFTNLVQMYSD